jgi:hypothetical protein
MHHMTRFIRYIPLLVLLVLFAGGTARVHAQEDDDPLFPQRKKEDPPRGIQESLSKMRIEKDKKDFNEMLRRGDDAAKLAASLKEGTLAGQQDQIAGIAKLIKKIREELGAEGSIDNRDSELPNTQSDAIKALKEQVNGLSEDLRRSTRFTVSASAIDRTNEILRLIKYLHG